MGNALCMCVGSSHVAPFMVKKGSAPAARLVNGLTGHVESVHVAEEGAAIKVAEVMLDNPGTFVMLLDHGKLGRRRRSSSMMKRYEALTSDTELKHGSCSSSCSNSSSRSSSMKRYEALPADTELKRGCLYFILPMHKLHQRAYPHELTAFLSLLASSKPINSCHKVSPCHHHHPCLTKKPPSPPLSECLPFLMDTHYIGASCASPSTVFLSLYPESSRAWSLLDQSQGEKNLQAPFISPFLQRPLSRSKSWKPSLQPISEAPSSSCGKHLTRMLSLGNLTRQDVHIY